MKKTHKRKTIKIIEYILLGIVAFFIIGAGYVLFLIRNLPSPSDLSTREIAESTKIYDRTGTVLLYEIHGDEKRTIISFDQIPDIVKQATLAAEDLGFYTEPAFDWKAIGRAIITNIKKREFSQGGSTITQQLVKNVFLTSEKTITRKIKELVLAVQLESKYNKDDILGLYLNQIPYGSNAYGIEAASQTYFSISARDLTLEKAATLAALLKAPSYYSPWGTHTKELLNRKNYVLNRMEEAGYISKKQNEQSQKKELVFSPPSLGLIKAPHFSLAVKDYLINRYGEYTVTHGGLNVITTLDMKLQGFAEEAVHAGALRNNELYGSKNAALVAQDPKTGQILALVGSYDYFDIKNDGNFNVATQGLRQPGSALKPFVYMTAFQKGYSPKTILYDVSTEFDTRNDLEHSYRPENFDGAVHGPIAMENALARSLNIPAVKTLYLAGFDNVLNNLHAFGITTLNERWRYGLSLTLGGGEVHLIDLVNAYSTLSQEGIHHTQTLVLKISDNNHNTLEEYHDDTNRVIDPQFPRLITNILSDPELRAPIFGSTLSLTIFPNREVALKTGTSEDHRDAWTVGYTPSLAVGVWAGNNDNTPMIRQGSSILAAVPIWHAFLDKALSLYQEEVFVRPDTISLPTKPMLNGEAEYTPIINGKKYPQLHSILYYIDKNNPLGDIPNNPENDSQFNQWERGVLNWASINIPRFSEYNLPLPEGTFSSFNELNQQSSASDIPTISFLKLHNGDFIRPPLTIGADISSKEDLARIEFYLNKRIINGFPINGKKYHYEYHVEGSLDPQNLFELKVITQSGKQGSATLLLFR